MADFPYPGKYTFVDVEIPNLYNDCICAISMIVIEDGQEVVRVTEYINPKTFFSPNNIRIHHIRREDVKDARTLKEFWQDYGAYFEQPYIIVAHNVMSDVSVLNKDLARFHTEIHATESLDTMDVMEQFYYKGTQKKGDLKLCNIATTLGIELDHHNPESDVNACYEIIRYMHDKSNMDITPYIKPIRKTRLKPSRHKMSTSQIRTFSKQAKRQIAKQHPSTKISMEAAKKLGDEAYGYKDYEGAIFYYELAVAKHWPNSYVYLRLAKIYEQFNLNYDALQVLEKGIQTLKKNQQNWYDLLSFQKKVSRKIREKKKQNKSQAIQVVEKKEVVSLPNATIPPIPLEQASSPPNRGRIKSLDASQPKVLRRLTSSTRSTQESQALEETWITKRFSKSSKTHRVLETMREVFHLRSRKKANN